ncbi:hypothetical protein SteCoe_17561 [Stentor coeruleus]|uniref:TNFR-Cys domain-containing protein n=1 Tax=Stentor coeruleus TaxID=5963 RepID=A0A1R2BYI7_9CILI|nr:hypothetical protein SteCoe_17561 [Stentor coeruleus]
MCITLVLALAKLWSATGNNLYFSYINFDDQTVEFEVITGGIENNLMITDVYIYVYQEPPGVLKGEIFELKMTNGTIFAQFDYYCAGDFTLIAVSPGYTSARSSTFGRANNNGPCKIAQINANPTTVFVNDQTIITALMMDNYGDTIFINTIDFIELGESSFDSIGSLFSYQEPYSTLISFSTPGIKKVFTIFDSIFTCIFSVIVSDCTNKIEVTFPEESVQLIHTIFHFSLQIRILNYITGNYNIGNSYKATIDSIPSGINSVSKETNSIIANINSDMTIINELYFIRSGYYIITASYSDYCIGSSVGFTVYDKALIISFPNSLVKFIQPKCFACLFDVLIEGYSSDLITKLTEWSYHVYLVLEPLEKIISNQRTENGTVYFSNLSIDSQGEFYLKAYAFNFLDATSDLFTISNLFSWSISVNTSNSIIINFDEELSEDLLRSDFLLSIDSDLIITAIFVHNSGQDYCFNIYPNETLPNQIEFTLKITKSNIVSTKGKFLNCIVQKGTLYPYEIKCNSFEYYEILLKKCFECNENCLECTGPTYYECSKCKNFILEGVCLPLCPLGFIEKFNECIPDKTKILSFTFEGTKNYFYDDVYNIEAFGVTASSSLSESLPFSVYLRGAYFPGQSALKIDFTNKMLFGSYFAISLWIKPKSADSTIISKYSASKNLFFSINLKSFHLNIAIEIENKIYSITSNSILEIEWNHLLIIYKTSLGLSIIVNNIEETPSFFTNSKFIDKINSFLFIGSDSLFNNTYTGFIYTLDFFLTAPYVSELISSDCKECNYCLVSGSCINPCDFNQYYDFLYKKCTECLEECPKKIFNVVVSINQENVASLIFSEPLKYQLKKSQLEVSINKKIVNFVLKSDTLNIFYVIPEIPGNATSSSFLNITIISDIASVYNSLLHGKTLVALLFITEDFIAEKKLEANAKAAKAKAAKGSIAGVSITLGVSFMNFNLASFFDFANTAEMFYASYLMNIKMNKVLSEFLIGLRMQDLIPNAFAKIFDSNQGNDMPEKLKKLGIHNNLILISGGGQLTLLSIFISILISVLILSRKQWIKHKLNLLKIKSSFKYSIFLRFWLQTYFELTIISSFSLIHSKFDNITQIINAVICLIILSVQIFLLGVMLYAIFKRGMLVDENAITDFEKKFSTFFEEFKNTGLEMWMFYILYILRRSSLVLSYLFIKDEKLQLAICITFSLSVPLYIISFRSFKNIEQNISNFCGEITIAGFYTFILLDELKDDGIMNENNANICIEFIIAAWAMNIFFSSFRTILNIINKIRDCRNKKRLEKTKNNKVVPKTFLNIDTTANVINT